MFLGMSVRRVLIFCECVYAGRPACRQAGPSTHSPDAPGGASGSGVRTVRRALFFFECVYAEVLPPTHPMRQMAHRARESGQFEEHSVFECVYAEVLPPTHQMRQMAHRARESGQFEEHSFFRVRLCGGPATHSSPRYRGTRESGQFEEHSFFASAFMRRSFHPLIPTVPWGLGSQDDNA